MDQLKQYFTLQQQIFDYFDYKEDWHVLPLSDDTASYWMLQQEADGSGVVVWSDTPLTEKSIEAGTHIYSGIIYTQRHLPRWVYPGTEYTLVCVDTQTDWNKLLMIFDNAKQCHDAAVMVLYKKVWGNE